VKARPADRNFGRGRSAAGLHASLDSLYRTFKRRGQDRSGVTLIPLRLLPRRCPFCGSETIIGHGRRRRQSHDQQRDWIWIRRGQCPPCRKTFSFLPVWSAPYGHYSCCCRQQALESICESGGRWEQSTPHTKDPNRFPDPATLRRWACRRLLSLWCDLQASRDWWPAWRSIFRAPTILAWDWAAAARNLHLEAKSP
jgi:Domain of unknown function (DUF6431)